MGIADPQTSLHGRSDLLESVVHPGLEDAQETLTEVFDEMREQLDKEMKRIAELRRILEDDPGMSLCLTPLTSQTHSTSLIRNLHLKEWTLRRMPRR
jgi:hypothetical protein